MRRIISVSLLQENISVLIAKVEEVSYPITGEYIEDSKAILNEIGVIDNEEDDDDHDEDGDDDDDLNTEEVEVEKEAVNL